MPAINLTVDFDSTTSDIFKQKYFDRHKYLVLYGGGGSGKSVFATQKILRRIIMEQNHCFIVARKVAATIKGSTYSEMYKTIRRYGLLPLAKIVESPTPRITFPAFRSEIIFTGMDTEDKIKSVTSKESDGITGIWIEEPTELTQDDFDQLDIRMRGEREYQQIIMTFNPIHEQHWLKRRWFDAINPKASVLKTTYKDNRFLPDEYRDTLESYKDTNPNKYRVYCLGEWGSYGDLVFDSGNWTVERCKYKPEDFDRILTGLDFGFKAPAAMVRVGVKDDELWIFDEFYQRELINSALIRELSTRLQPGTHIIADCAEPDRIEEFNASGFRVEGVRDKSRQASIDWLKGKRIHIDDRCPNMIREIQTLEWKKTRDGRFIEGEFADGCDDHAIDALRYAVEPLRTGARPAQAYNPMRR